MSNPNTIPEFLGIIVGTIVVGSVVGVIITMAFEGVTKNIKNKLQTNPYLILSQKTSQKAFAEIPKTKVDIFVKDTNLIQQDPIRYMTGSSGEVSRVLSQNYYRVFFSGTKTSENTLEFLEYRANLFNAIIGTDLNKESIKEISNKYYGKVSTLIFFLCYHESFFGETNIFRNDFVSEVYKIILEEHNRVCPKGQEEINEFKIELFDDIKEIYSKYNSISTNDKSAVDSIIDFEDDDDDDDDDFDYFEENNLKYAEAVFNDFLINKMSNIFWIGKLENIMIQETEKYIADNQLKGNPLGGLMIMNRMQRSRDAYKNQLISNKNEFGICDEDIEYIISKVYTTVHTKFIES